MDERRGRPKETHPEDAPRQFERHYKEYDGITETWRYDLDKFPNGPIEVIVNYPIGYKTPQELLETKNEGIPLTHRQWLNPANGKMVGYARAKALNLIK